MQSQQGEQDITEDRRKKKSDWNYCIMTIQCNVRENASSKSSILHTDGTNVAISSVPLHKQVYSGIIFYFKYNSYV